jgi:hypothetical protein
MLIYLGGDDTLQTSPREVVLNYFSARARDVRALPLYPDGDHSLWGCEQRVSDDIVSWIRDPDHQPST